MNKLGSLSLFALATIAGSAKAAVIDQCTTNTAFSATTISCTTANGATAGRVTGTLTAGGAPNTIIVNHTKETNEKDSTTGYGRNNLNQTMCNRTDRNPSLASTETDTGCVGSTILLLIVQNRN